MLLSDDRRTSGRFQKAPLCSENAGDQLSMECVLLVPWLVSQTCWRPLFLDVQVRRGHQVARAEDGAGVGALAL